MNYCEKAMGIYDTFLCFKMGISYSELPIELVNNILLTSYNSLKKENNISLSEAKSQLGIKINSVSIFTCREEAFECFKKTLNELVDKKQQIEYCNFAINQPLFSMHKGHERYPNQPTNTARQIQRLRDEIERNNQEPISAFIKL